MKTHIVGIQKFAKADGSLLASFPETLQRPSARKADHSASGVAPVLRDAEYRVNTKAHIPPRDPVFLGVVFAVGIHERRWICEELKEFISSGSRSVKVAFE